MIEGRIIRIVDERTLVANIGIEQGVAVGQEFVVIQAIEEVIDPQTNESLGVWEMIKARVVAVHVQPRLTTLMPVPDEKQQTAVLSERMAWGPHGAPVGSEEVSLAIDRTSMSGRRRPDVIRIGDTIRSVR